VELTVHRADLSKYQEYYARYLYDGQTGEMLASTESKKGVKSAFVKDAPLLQFDDANARIDALIADDRKQ
jgi:hypothetical protein